MTSDAKPLVSILMVCFNKLEYSVRAYEHIRLHTDPALYELIVVDNASEDGTAALFGKLAANTANLTVIVNDENLGFVDGNNVGAEQATGKYLLFLNNDTAVQPGWLEPLIEVMETRQDAGAVGSKLLYPDGSLQEAGGVVFSDASGWNFGKHKDPDHPEYTYLREADYCSGAALMTRTELFRELGGFDRRFAPAYFEDSDLCFSLREKGLKTYYQPESKVVHHEGATAGTDTSTGYKRFQEINKSKFIEKWRHRLKEQPHPTGDPRYGRFIADRRCRGGRQTLVCADEPPQYDRQGGGLTLYNFVRLLVEGGHHVAYVLKNSNVREPDVDLKPYVRAMRQMGVMVVALDEQFDVDDGKPSEKVTSAAMGFVNALTGRDYESALLWRAGEGEWYLNSIQKRRPGIRTAVNTADLHYLREGRELKNSVSPGDWRKYLVERNTEVGVYRRVDAVLCISPDELRLLSREVPAQNLFHVPDIFDVYDDRKPFEERGGVVFLAGFRHAPNVDAARWLLDKVMPKVRVKAPHIRLTLVGDSPPQDLVDLQDDNTIITGYVPELEPYLTTARVGLAPVRYGAGVKGKILQYMAAATPCVTTTVGIEGTAMVGGRDVFLADDADAFAEAVIALHEGDEWAAYSQAGLDYVQRNHSVEAMRKPLFEALFPQPVKVGGPLEEETDFFLEAGRAFDLLDRGSARLAEDMFIDLIRRFPDRPLAPLGRAKAVIAQKDFRRAAALLDALEVEHPDLDEIDILRAESYCTEGRTGRAKRTLEAVTQRNPEARAAWQLLAVVYPRLGLIDEAIHAWNEIVRLQPEDRGMLLSRAKVLHLAGRLDKAVDDYSALAQHYLDIELPEIAYQMDKRMCTAQKGEAFREEDAEDFSRYSDYVKMAPHCEAMGKKCGRSGPVSTLEFGRAYHLYEQTLACGQAIPQDPRINSELRLQAAICAELFASRVDHESED